MRTEVDLAEEYSDAIMALVQEGGPEQVEIRAHLDWLVSTIRDLDFKCNALENEVYHLEKEIEALKYVN